MRRRFLWKLYVWLLGHKKGSLLWKLGCRMHPGGCPYWCQGHSVG